MSLAQNFSRGIVINFRLGHSRRMDSRLIALTRTRLPYRQGRVTALMHHKGLEVPRQGPGFAAQGIICQSAAQGMGGAQG